jgi:hypothetical protein
MVSFPGRFCAPKAFGLAINSQRLGRIVAAGSYLF